MSTAFRVAGIDCGATLCKLALRSQTLDTVVLPSSDLDGIERQLSEWKPERAALTGGGAEVLAERLAKGGGAGFPVERAQEFEAWARGAPELARAEQLDLPPGYMLVSLGTGTSVLLVESSGARRLGGSALGGGTLMGLGQLLLGVEAYGDIVDLASRGDRRRVDLLVGDIYPGADLPLPRELNAASFGKLESRDPADLAHALMGLIGENVGLICAHLMQAARAEIGAIIYCGSTLENNPALVRVLEDLSRMLGVTGHFLAQGAYCGAVGAAALAAE
jgi:type II pantothenate kinase